jgi:hypothetical protein
MNTLRKNIKYHLLRSWRGRVAYQVFRNFRTRQRLKHLERDEQTRQMLEYLEHEEISYEEVKKIINEKHISRDEILATLDRRNERVPFLLNAQIVKHLK